MLRSTFSRGALRRAKIKLREGTDTAVLFGHHDRHLKIIEEEFGVRLFARGEELSVDGTPEQHVKPNAS